MSTNQAETALDPDEPQTPLWFTLLGLGLFLAGGIFLLATHETEEEAAAAVEASEAAVQAEEAEGAENPEEAAPTPDPHAGHGHD